MMLGPTKRVVAAFTQEGEGSLQRIAARPIFNGCRDGAKTPMRLLYFSPVPAGSYAQRPHFMVRAWLAWGIESVLWVNPYPCRLPRWQDLRRKGNLHDQGTPLDPRVRVLDVPAMPIEPLPFGSRLNRVVFERHAWREIERFAFGEAETSGGNDRKTDLLLGIGRPCSLALAALRELRPAASFFDAMDNFPEFHRGLSRRSMSRHEDAVAAEVDLVVASSTFLTEKFARRGLRVEMILNAYEETDRGREGENEDAPSPPLPILGYLGCIGGWFDWPLVLELAEAMPQAQVELVGPCVVPPPRRPPANVRMLPACKQSEVADRLSRFSVGLIPFLSDALTDGVDPIKYYDYRAAGLPVLSTRFGEMTLRGPDDGVYFLDRVGNLAETVSAALSHCRDLEEIRRFQQDNTWTARFRQSQSLRSLLPML
jgi:hypothetical protein